MKHPVAQFIDQMGGPSKVARAINYAPGAVAQWKVKRRIPRSAWPEIMTAWPEVTLDALMAVERASQEIAA